MRIPQIAGLMALTVGAGAAAVAQGATIYDVRKDFSVAANPNGNWRYGAMTYTLGVPDASTLPTHLFTVGNHDIVNTILGGANTATIEAWYTNPVDPNVSHNYGPNDYSNFGITWSGTTNAPGGEVAMTPGTSLSDPLPAAVSRFTATIAGGYSISAQFTDNQDSGGGADVYVYINGISDPAFLNQNSGNIVGAGPSYTNNLVFLNPGDTVDFIVGARFGNGGNNTALTAILSLPEPASMGLIALVGSMLLRRSPRIA